MSAGWLLLAVWALISAQVSASRIYRQLCGWHPYVFATEAALAVLFALRGMGVL